MDDKKQERMKRNDQLLARIDRDAEAKFFKQIKMDDKKQERMKRSIEMLTSMARRAANAKDRFERALEKAKEQKDWADACDLFGISPEADASDWMC